MSWKLLRYFFFSLLIVYADASYGIQQQHEDEQQQHVAFDDTEDVGQQSLIELDPGNEALSNSVFGVLNAMLTQVQEINQKVVKIEPSKLTACPAQEKEKLAALTDTYQHLLNITETLNKEVQELKRGQGDGCNRKCRNLQPEQTISNDLAKQVDCLRRGANLEMKKLVFGTYFYDKVNRMTWYEARNFCLKHGLQMATFDSLSKVKEVYTAGTTPGFGFWVGANDIKRAAGDYRWISDESKVQQELWYRTFPKLSKVGQETCVYVLNNFLWDIQCGTKDRFVMCEMPKECHEILRFA